MPGLVGGFGKICINMNTIKRHFLRSIKKDLDSPPFHSILLNAPLSLRVDAWSGNGWEGPTELELRSKLGASKDKLNPFYVTGFTDAKGCFFLDMSKRKNN